MGQTQPADAIPTQPTASAQPYIPESASEPQEDSPKQQQTPAENAIHETIDNSRIILQDNSITAFAEYIQKNNCSKILILTGAGISTSAGIPDFRSPSTGLYHNLKSYNLPYPEAIFSKSFFIRNPYPFYTLARSIVPGSYTPTRVHRFMKSLAVTGRLLRVYTQNIDMLERVAGVPESMLVEAHGSFHMFECVGVPVPPYHDPNDTKPKPTDPSTQDDENDSGDASSLSSESSCESYPSGCGTKLPLSEIRPIITSSSSSSTIPTIPTCPSCKCIMKPCITFYGEQLPSRFHSLIQTDTSSCDALIVMGTSLTVYPVSGIVDMVSRRVPRLLINNVVCGDNGMSGEMGFDFGGKRQRYRRDAVYVGSCDDGVDALAKLIGIEIAQVDPEIGDQVDRIAHALNHVTIV